MPTAPMSPEAARAELAARGGGGEVQLTVDGPIARLVLDRPEAANALSGAMLLSLEQAVARLEQAVAEAPALGGPVGLIVRGAGERAFCAGSDLTLVRANLDRPELAAALAAFMHQLTERLRALPLVSVAAIEGAAVGGGAELATACDYRVLSRSGFIRFVHARLGLSPGWAGGARLVGLLGRRRALELLSTARRVSAARALDWGLVDRLSDPGQAEAQAHALLAPVLRSAPASVRAAKRLVHAADTTPVAQALEQERAVFESLWGGPAQARALSKGRP
ncbi:MAG: enoyl-CoA hydratase/isomerase family protein [Alphaproteobacteria bacterium]|nr:enoyl-CoA hydratase/isomerase family protein [Alphaproteobacteria bacterium]MCB9791601.1 enoyl-CoA hydratase/isomerase family protein [Alphaproteobacteria bacterium]